MRATAVVVALVWTIYLFWVLTGPWGLGLQTVFRTWVFSGVLIAAAAICLARAALVTHDRVPWAILGSGMALWALATVYWSVFLKDLAEPPYPSIADALYLGFYPAAYVALMLLLRKRLRGVGPSVWLDGLIGAFAVGAIGVAFVIPRLVDLTGGSLAVVATNLAYPLGDLLLIALVVGMFALTGWRPGRKWLLIGTGVVLFAIADTVYLYEVANGTFAEGELVDAIWPAGMILLALAAWQAQPARPTVAFEG